MIKQLGLLSATVLATFALAGFASAQVCPNPLPFGFEGLNGNGIASPNNQAILNVTTSSDSSDPSAMDNTAHAGLSEPISISFGSTRVAPGSPFSLYFSLGVVPTGISSPATIDGTVWLDVANPANVFTLIDGLAISGGVPNPFGTTAGPATPNVFSLNTGTDAAIFNTCFTVQALVLDPAAPAPFNLAVSNPVALGIVPRLQGVSPSITQAGSAVQLQAGGLNPAGGDFVSLELGLGAATSANGFLTVPAGAVSGKLGVNIGGLDSVPTDDGIEDYLVVTDTTLTPGPTLLTATADTTIPLLNSSRATGFGNLANPGSSGVWSIALNAGDIIDIEVYSMDAGLTRILDGTGSSVNPFAVEGFDPLITLRTNGNPDQLVFDTAVTGQNLHTDDDGGPGNNARMRWQARYNATYDIVVTDSDPSAFVTGDYLINVRVQDGVPGVSGFLAGTARANIAAQGSVIAVNAPNVVPGGVYSVILEPKAGGPFTSTTVTTTTVTGPDTLRFTVPTNMSLPIGLHQVRIRDDATLYEGIAWDNSEFSPIDGVLPDLLCVSGATYTIADATSPSIVNGLMEIGNLNNESVQYGPTTAGPTVINNGFLRAVVPAAPWSVLYAEAIAVDPTSQPTPTSPPVLFDSTSQFLAGGGVGMGMYNPILNVFYPNLLNSGPYNDNDGIVPAPLFSTPMGIGRSSALIDLQAPIVNPNGGAFLFLVRENIITGTGADHAVMMNIVAQ